MPKPKKIERLPEDFRIYFWDCDFDSLTFKKYKIFISERILNFGTLDSVKWLFANINKTSILDILKNSRRLNKKTKNFWKIYLSTSK